MGLEGRRAGIGPAAAAGDGALDAVLLRTEVLSLAGRNALEMAAVAGVRRVVAQVPSLELADGGLAEAVAAGLASGGRPWPASPSAMTGARRRATATP